MVVSIVTPKSKRKEMTHYLGSNASMVSTRHPQGGSSPHPPKPGHDILSQSMNQEKNKNKKIIMSNKHGFQ